MGSKMDWTFLDKHRPDEGFSGGKPAENDHMILLVWVMEKWGLMPVFSLIAQLMFPSQPPPNTVGRMQSGVQYSYRCAIWLTLLPFKKDKNTVWNRGLWLLQHKDMTSAWTLWLCSNLEPYWCYSVPFELEDDFLSTKGRYGYLPQQRVNQRGGDRVFSDGLTTMWNKLTGNSKKKAGSQMQETQFWKSKLGKNLGCSNRTHPEGGKMRG